MSKALIVFLCTLLFASASRAAADDEVTLDFVEADIESVVRAVAMISQRNFVIDPRVKGTINIVSGKPIGKSLAYPMLVSALRIQGYAVVETATLTKIMPEIDAKSQAGPVVQAGGGGEQVATRVFSLRHEAAAQVVVALKPLVGPNQSIAAYPGSNAVVITDTADNLARLEKIIAAVDVPHGEDPQVVPLQHTAASEIAAMLGKLFPAGAGTSGGGAGSSTAGLSVVADPRGNRLLLRADNPSLLLRVRTLIADLDQAEAGFGNFHVVPIRHAEATRVAELLRALLTSPESAAGGAATASRASPAAVGQNAGAASAATGFGAHFDRPVERTANAGRAVQPGSIVQADEATNSLIVTAPPAVFRNLEQVIARLDRRRPQVFIEALLVELTADKTREFGIQWQDLSGLASDKLRLFGGTNFGAQGQNIIGATKNPTGVGTGLNIGISRGQVTLPGIGTVTNLGMLARFLEENAHANILSTPNLTTLDNEEAKIVIGQNLPFVTGAYTSNAASATVTPFQTYERKDVGLVLKVRPQVTADGVVRVQIYQEASNVVEATIGNSNGPVTNKRQLETQVLVDDGGIVALGGLINEEQVVDEEKVPGLGDVPVLGNLFRYRSDKRVKRNLMIFLRPTVLRDRAGGEALAAGRYHAMRQGQQDYRALPDGAAAPQLPELPQMQAVPGDR